MNLALVGQAVTTPPHHKCRGPWGSTQLFLGSFGAMNFNIQVPNKKYMGYSGAGNLSGIQSLQGRCSSPSMFSPSGGGGGLTIRARDPQDSSLGKCAGGIKVPLLFVQPPTGIFQSSREHEGGKNQKKFDASRQRKVSGLDTTWTLSLRPPGQDTFKVSGGVQRPPCPPCPFPFRLITPLGRERGVRQTKKTLFLDGLVHMQACKNGIIKRLASTMQGSLGRRRAQLGGPKTQCKNGKM